MVRKRDTYVYELKDSHTIVYYGISNEPRERLEQHERSKKKFTHMRVITGSMHRENAEKKETELIQRYQHQHNGIPPKYNNYKAY